MQCQMSNVKCQMSNELRTGSLLSLFGNWKLEIRKLRFYGGQALITLLFYVLILTTVTTAAVVLLIINSQSSVKLQESVRAYYVAESGAEDALLRVLRDPTYTGGTLPVGDGTATINVTNGASVTITSTGTIGAFVRKIQLVVNYASGRYTIASWKEIN
jgi:hypothetical protein